MKISDDAFQAKLEGELGSGALNADPDARAARAVDGKIPSLLCLPSTPEEVSSILRVSAEAGAAVVPWGGGTSMSLGNIPRRMDVVMELARLDKLIEHDDANLTATVQAGMSIAAFQEALGRRRQFLAVDPPQPARATVGGILAANVNGARRMRYGGVRDLVVGMKMALATGERIKTGGKVVKNVAGYDLGKLFIGSLGTLGIITEATFRMAPLPETAASFVASGPPARCAEFVADMERSPLLPAAVTTVSDIRGVEFQTPAVAVWVEGFEGAVTRHLHDLEAMAARAGMAGHVLDALSHRRLWEEIRDFDADGSRPLFRLAVPAGSVAEILANLSRAVGEDNRYVAHAESGTIYVSIDGSRPDRQCFSRLADLVGRHKGHAVMLAAPVAMKQGGIDVWGPAPPGLSLMREIKRRFDPQEILNPGRFVASL